MARIRSTHPGQWRDQDFVECSFGARLLTIAIRNEADDQGVFEWKPKQIKMNCFPADNVDIEPLLAELVENRIVKQFEVDGRLLGAIRNFRVYQRPKKPNSVYPITDEIRDYVALNGSKFGTSSELDEDEAGVSSPPVRKSAKQMEDGGDKMEDVGGKKTSAVASRPPPALGPVFIELPTNRFESKGEEVAIYEPFVEEMQRLYPAVDVRDQLRFMRAWLVTNSEHRKTRTGMKRFINGWLSRQQDRGGGAPRETIRGNGNGRGKPPSAHDKFNAGAALYIASLGGDADGRGEAAGGGDPDRPQLPLLAS